MDGITIIILLKKKKTRNKTSKTLGSNAEPGTCAMSQSHMDRTEKVVCKSLCSEASDYGFNRFNEKEINMQSYVTNVSVFLRVELSENPLLDQLCHMEVSETRTREFKFENIQEWNKREALKTEVALSWKNIIEIIYLRIIYIFLYFLISSALTSLNI